MGEMLEESSCGSERERGKKISAFIPVFIHSLPGGDLTKYCPKRRANEPIQVPDSWNCWNGTISTTTASGVDR